MITTKVDQKKCIAALISSPEASLVEIKKHISEGANVNLEDDQGVTPLVWAVRNDRVDIVELLIEQGASVNKECCARSSFLDDILKPVKKLFIDRNESNRCHTPLLEATYRGLSKMSSLLITSGANPNVWHEKMGTPLGCAMKNKLIDVVILLVKYGADANAIIESNGTTPLIWAAQNDQDVLELLVDHGADLDESLGFAAEHGYLEICELLLLIGAKVNSRNRYNQTPLARAAYAGNADICALLLENGARENNVTNEEFSSSLVTAVRGVLGDICLFLLNKGSAVNFYPKGYTPLIWAVRNGHSDIFNLLVERGASLDESLWCAATLGYLEVCTLLLSKGAHVDGGDLPEWGSCQNPALMLTPLQNAAREGHLTICALLLKEGAHIEGNGNFSPFFFAAFLRHADVCKLLITSGANIKLPNNRGILAIAVQHKGFEEVCTLLIDNGADVNSTEVNLHDSNLDSEESVLKFACDNNYLRLVGLLILKGADIYRKSAAEKTPLQEAAERNQKEMVKTILLHGFLQVMAKYSKLSYEKIWSTLCCLKRKCPQMSKDVRFMILKMLAEDVIAFSAQRIRNNKPVPLQFKNLAFKMGAYAPDNFAIYIQEAQKSAQDADVKNLLNTELLEKNLGSLLRAVI